MSSAPDLEAELIAAIRRARHPRVAAKLSPLGIPLGFSPQLMIGVSRVEFFRAGRGACYQPAEDGRVALVVAIEETLFSTASELVGLDPATGISVTTSELAGREIVDLLAIDPESQEVGTRLGIGTALGRDAIDDVRFRGGILRLVDQPLAWLRQPTGAAFVIDWSSAVRTLADLDRPVTSLADRQVEVCCSSLALAERVEATFRRPLPIPSLTVAA